MKTTEREWDKKWDEMSAKDRDRLIAKLVGVDLQLFDWIWESGQYHFSTDFTWAWVAIKKLIPDGWEPCVEFNIKTQSWTVTFRHASFDAIVESGTVESEVACKAILKIFFGS